MPLTYLPYPDFRAFAKVFDNDLLLGQQLTVIEVVDILHSDTFGLEYYHPGVQMWKDFEPQLCELGISLYEESVKRKLGDPKIKAKLEWQLECATGGSYTLELPPWFGNKNLHLSHRSYLIGMNFEHYSLHFDQDTPLHLPLVWPSIDVT